MPVLNYTTTIDPFKTLGEIQKILANAGANGIAIEYDRGQPVGLSFRIMVQDRAVAFRLPARWQGVLKAMKQDAKVARRFVTQEQALRVSWRILKDWIEAQLALIQAELATLAEVFLPYAVTNSGATLYESFETNGLPLLPSPVHN